MSRSVRPLLWLVFVGLGVAFWVGWRQRTVAPVAGRPEAVVAGAVPSPELQPSTVAAGRAASPPDGTRRGADDPDTAEPAASPAGMARSREPRHTGEKRAASAPPALPANRQNARRVLDDLQFALRDYRTAVGGNPVGTNAEITSALLGNNARQVKVVLPEGAVLNGVGEMCDHWGTPYFFHQLSGTRMEIRSAGPDRRLWTADDLTK